MAEDGKRRLREWKEWKQAMAEDGFRKVGADVEEYLSSKKWGRTTSAELWHKLVITCWEEHAMLRLLARAEDRHPGEFATRADSPIRTRLHLAQYAIRYWGELAVRKTLEEGR